MRGGTPSCAWLLVPTVLAGCGLPDAPAVPSDDTGFRTEGGEAEPEGLANDPPIPLAVRPGDIITVSLIREVITTYAGLIVDEQGTVNVPIVGDVRIGGLSMQDAATRIEEALRAFDRVSEVTVAVTTPTGQMATVLGAVTTPGRYQVTPGVRVADLLAMAGGPSQLAERGEVTVLAELGGARLMRDGRTVPVSIARAVEGDPRHNVRVHPGDHLYVPPGMGSRVAVLGEVGAPTVIAYRNGLRLLEALAIAGGITIDGDDNDVRIVRGDFRNPRVYTASAQDVVDGQTHDVMLHPGDVIWVTDHWIAAVGEVIDRLGPILSIGITTGLAIGLSRLNDP
jgi:polysaccharide export outer membrane protein